MHDMHTRMCLHRRFGTVEWLIEATLTTSQENASYVGNDSSPSL